MPTVSRSASRALITTKSAEVYTAIDHHIAVLKRVPTQLIKCAAEGFLSPAVPVAARLAVELFQALFYQSC
jgi:hypothetical protein